MQSSKSDTKRSGRDNRRNDCIWRACGVVSQKTCDSHQDSCEGCPVYATLEKLSRREQKHFFGRDYFDFCSVDACIRTDRPCPFSGFCMPNWSRTNVIAMHALTLMGIGGLSLGYNASLVQQVTRRFGLRVDLIQRLLELYGPDTSGSKCGLDPYDLDLHTTEELFSMTAAASFMDCLDLLNVEAFAESMFESALRVHGLPGSISEDRSPDGQRNALWALQGLALLGVVEHFDPGILRDLHETMTSTRHASMTLATMSLTIQRIIEPQTHLPIELEPTTIEEAVSLVTFPHSIVGSTYHGREVTPRELAAAVLVTRALGILSEDGTMHAGRLLADEVLQVVGRGACDMTNVQQLLHGILASGLVPDGRERTAFSTAMVRSFQARFRKLGDMRADPVSLLATLGADNLVHESESFDTLASAIVAKEEVDPALMGCGMPSDRFYATGHSWVSPSSDGTVRIGIDDLVAHLVGRIDAVEMTGPGGRLRRGKPAIRLIRGGESVVVRSPMDGYVVVVNQSVIDSPDILANRPYDDGWLLVIEPIVNERDLSGLMFGRRARGWQRQEAERLRGMFHGDMATAADGAILARDALTGLPGVRWSKVLGIFLNARSHPAA